MEDQHNELPVAVPVAGRQIWDWFRELDRQRTGTGYGPNPITFEAIKAWADLRKITPRQWEIDALLELDLKRRILAAEKTEEEQTGEVVVKDQPLTKSLFKAIFGPK